MSEMVERVARALVAAKFGEEGLLIFEPVPDDFPLSLEASLMFKRRIDDAMKEARAAIEAMREPTEAMRDRYYDFDVVGYGPDGSGHDLVWQAGIDAALKK